MSLTVTQADATAPPLTVAVSGLPQVVLPARVTGIVQRSTDGVRYSTVRGLAEATITAGALASTADYEFKPGTVNTYRAGVNQWCDTFTRTVADSWGTSDTGQAWDTTAPGAAADVAGGVGTVAHASASTSYPIYLPATDVGDVDLSMSVATNLGAAPGGGTVSAGLITRRVGSDSYAATITIATSGAVSLAASWPSGGTSTATPLTYTGTQTYRLRMRVDGHRIRAKVWDPAATPEPSWQIDETVPSGSRVTGGQIGLRTARASGNTNGGLVWSVDDFVADVGRPAWLFTGVTITPGLTGHWLCSTMRSFLNRQVTVGHYGEPGRAARGGSTVVAGRTPPIGQVELSGGRNWSLVLRAYSVAEARGIDFLVASGDVLWLLCPASSRLPGGYYRAGQSAGAHGRPGGDDFWLTLPMTEVAAPSADIATAQSTVDTLLSLYGTVEDMLAALGTVEDMLDLIGDPSEVVVDA